MKVFFPRICWCAAALAAFLQTGSASAAAPRQAEPPKGLVVLWGGGAVPSSVSKRFSKAAGIGGAVWVGGNERPNARELNWTAISLNNSNLTEQLSGTKTAWVDVTSLPAGAEPVDQMLVDSRFLQSPPPASLVEELNSQPGLIGVGIPRGSALFVQGRHLQASGSAAVVVCLPASVSRPSLRPMLSEELENGQEADLIALSRAAIARLGPAFPPEHIVQPDVPKGSLLICGGGDLSDALWKRFVALAGGFDAPIVVLPIATPNPNDRDPKGMQQLKALGCTHITVLNQHTHEDVETPAFAEALKQARGVWFVGGRQWKYVDAYQGTVAEKLFHEVLERGGVIGGSSAGAAIQAEYMCRGDPLGNRDITAEGYEQGLGFLPGTAVDIHVTQRGRGNDMIRLINTFPLLLGIALDENTAIEVHGHVLTVLGAGKADIVDAIHYKEVPLSAGQGFDMAARKVMK